MKQTNCNIKGCINEDRYCRLHSPGSPEKPIALIKMFSAKRAEINKKEYKPAAQKYLATHPVCEVCRKAKADQVHHKFGRIGKALLNGFLAVCDACHLQIESNPKEAKGAGHSESRLHSSNIFEPEK